MDKIFAIVMVGSNSPINRNGKTCIYASKELADADLHAMPDSWTDYDHYEVKEFPVVNAESDLVFKVNR